MITINTAENGGYYVHICGAMFGPYGKDGEPLSQTVTYRHPSDHILDQRRQILDEGNVFHQKIDGYIAYNPTLFQGTAVLSSDYRLPRTQRRRDFWSSDWRRYEYKYVHPSELYNFAYYGGTPWSTWNTFSDIHAKGLTEWSFVEYGRYFRRVYTVEKYFADQNAFRVKLVTDWVESTLDFGPMNSSDPSSMLRTFKRAFSELSPRTEVSYIYTTTVIPYYDQFSFVKPAVTPGSVKKAVDRLRPDRFDRFKHIDELPHFGDVAMNAVEKLDANDANLIAFVRDLKDVKSLIPKLKNLRNLKTHASNYLAINYGVLPTISDLHSIVESFSKNIHRDRDGRRLTYGNTSVKEVKGNSMDSVERRVKIAVDPTDSSINSLLEGLENWGFGLNFTNLWDLVPYSFVIDWFVDIGDFLERVDTNLRLMRLPIAYCTQSEKRITRVTNLSDLGIPGSFGRLELTNYNRWTSTNVPLPPMKLETDVQVQKHWLESAALIIQRRD